MTAWTVFPYLGDYHFTAASLKKHWARLHAGDKESLPGDDRVLHAWVLFHNGKFEDAAREGLAMGAAGTTVANKATSVYANYLEPHEATRLQLFQDVAERAALQAQTEPQNPNAWYWQAYALGRYSQGISVAKALAQGLGTRVRNALETTIRLEPLHADAYVALGAFHAEVIDKVGVLIGGMTYGAKKEVGMKLYEDALKLNPASAIGMVEYANALVMMEGERRAEDAKAWFEKAARCEPMDAQERLDVEMARAELTR